MKSSFLRLSHALLKPFSFKHIIQDVVIALPRIIAGLMLSLEFGSSKFGLPWSTTEEMGLFQVADWFPEDVVKFGLPFTLAPTFFAWMGAFTEAVGGLFWIVGFGTRFWSVLIGLTMIVAIMFQKWPDALEYGSSWPLLPAMGFLWIALYTGVIGSGKIGIDHFMTRKMFKNE